MKTINEIIDAVNAGTLTIEQAVDAATTNNMSYALEFFSPNKFQLVFWDIRKLWKSRQRGMSAPAVPRAPDQPPMKITVTRIDPLGGCPDPNQHRTLLTTDAADSWESVVAVLRRHGINQFQPQQLADFHAEAPTETITFQHREFIDAGIAAYDCNVNYVIAVTA